MIDGRRLLAAIGRRLRIPTGPDDQSGVRMLGDDLTANFAAIVVNGLFFPTAGKILGAGLVLTWFVSDLTRSAFVVGLLIPIQYGVALLAQPWIAQWISRRPRRVPFYRNQALVRAGLWCALAATAWSVGADRPELLLLVFFAVVAADAFAAGVGNIAFSDVLARVIPKSLRGRARGGRGMAGAVIGGIAGALIATFVSPDSGLGLFAMLFAIAGLCYGLGGVTFVFVSEPTVDAPRAQPRREGLRSYVREMLARADYRRFLAIQTLLLPVTQGLVFFSLFGRRVFNLDLQTLGLLLISDAVAPFVGNYFWGRWADRFGDRLVLGISAVVSLLAPALALVLAAGGEHWPHAGVAASFSVIVFAIGVASAGVDLASKNFILDLAPDEARRPVYIGVNDTLIAVPTMLFVGAGAAIDWLGFRPVFIAVAAAATIAACLAMTGEAGGVRRHGRSPPVFP
jgi:MFS family permease